MPPPLPRQVDPNWWLGLPVVHVPHLTYADGASGLMSVPLGGGEGGAPLERHLVAFADVEDAKALAMCCGQVGVPWCWGEGRWRGSGQSGEGGRKGGRERRREGACPRPP